MWDCIREIPRALFIVGLSFFLAIPLGVGLLAFWIWVAMLLTGGPHS